MIVFATSDKGGTGRSVTASNVAYRQALQGHDACYLDFDFGSPTSGAIFDLPEANAGVTEGGLHDYLLGDAPEVRRIDVWAESQRDVLRMRPVGAGKLSLMPGSIGRGEFGSGPDIVRRCADLLMQMDEEFGLVLVDLSAGRSYATDIVLAATARPEMSDIQARWLVFHRWTRQHIVAASGLAHGPHGILETGEHHGHDPRALRAAIRFVRTAVPAPPATDQGLRPEQLAWMEICDRRLNELAGRSDVGLAYVLAQIPLDPVLQWQEQLLSNEDVWSHRTANQETVDAFAELAKNLTDPQAWEGL
jgi:hypothetical protein